MVAGEISSQAKINYEEVIRHAVKEIGYDKENGYDLDQIDIKVLIEK